ncbi:hypothetical protein DIPPA_10579 [Diplonema papillatum]|nr:hypothetical protein DIPPA_10579 [Diplonema papillatum]
MMKEERKSRVSPQEERLRKMIAAFAAEARQELKWEVTRGRPVPSAESVALVLRAEAAADRQKVVDTMAENRAPTCPQDPTARQSCGDGRAQAPAE